MESAANSMVIPRRINSRYEAEIADRYGGAEDLMQKPKLGKSDLEISAFGFWYIGLSFGFGPATGKDEVITVSHTYQVIIIDDEHHASCCWRHSYPRLL